MGTLSQSASSSGDEVVGVPGTWSRATVSEVERGNRGVLVDELVALAVVYETYLTELSAPRGAPKAELEDIRAAEHHDEHDDMLLVLAEGNVMLGVVSHPSAWDDDGRPRGIVFRVSGHALGPEFRPAPARAEG